MAGENGLKNGPIENSPIQWSRGYYSLQYICFRDFFGISAADFGIYPLGRGIKGLTKCTANEFIQSLFSDSISMGFVICHRSENIY